MKHIKLINEWFGKPKDGDVIASRVFNIIKKENIKIEHSGGYRVNIDDNIYSFLDYGGFLRNYFRTI